MEDTFDERRGKAPRPPLRRVGGDMRFRDGSRTAEALPYRRLRAESGSPAPRGRQKSQSATSCLTLLHLSAIPIE